MKRTRLKLMASILFLVSGYCNAAEETRPLNQLIKEAENILKGDTSASVLSMKIKKEAYQREYDMMVMTDDRATNNKVLIKMLGPALWRGNATLKVEDKITFYEPRNNRTTIMGSSMLGDNWMGSHFTNDDLLRETDLSRHYSYTLVSQQTDRKENGAQVTDYTIALLPKPTAPVAWGKVIYHLYTDQDKRVYPRKLDYFKQPSDPKPVRTLAYSDVKQFDNRKVPTRLTMTLSDKPSEFTELDYRKIKFGPDFPADAFSERALR